MASEQVKSGSDEQHKNIQIEHRRTITRALLDAMWDRPVQRAVPKGRSLPKNFSVGLASGNPEKIEATGRVLHQFGYQAFTHVNPPEENILLFLQARDDTTRTTSIPAAVFAESIIKGIAALKPLSVFEDNPRVTHGLGLDTDFIILNQESFTPVGKPKTWEDLKNILRLVSNNTIKIMNVSCLMDMASKRVVSSEIVTMLVRFAAFEPEIFIREMDITVPGLTSGGIDIANPAVIQFLHPDAHIIVSRVDNFPPDPGEDYILNQVRVFPEDAPYVLADYVRGTAEKQIASTIYNGIVNPVLYPLL